MFDPRPDFGRPDDGILSALRAEPAPRPATIDPLARAAEALTAAFAAVDLDAFNATLRRIGAEMAEKGLILDIGAQGHGPAAGAEQAKPRFVGPSLAEARAIVDTRLAVQTDVPLEWAFVTRGGSAAILPDSVPDTFVAAEQSRREFAGIFPTEAEGQPSETGMANGAASVLGRSVRNGDPIATAQHVDLAQGEDGGNSRDHLRSGSTEGADVLVEIFGVEDRSVTDLPPSLDQPDPRTAPIRSHADG